MIPKNTVTQAEIAPDKGFARITIRFDPMPGVKAEALLACFAETLAQGFESTWQELLVSTLVEIDNGPDGNHPIAEYVYKRRAEEIDGNGLL